VTSSRIAWRSGEHGYGLIAKTLHWTVAGAIASQFVVGYVMEADSSGRGRGRGRGRSGESGRGRGRGRGGDYELFGDDALLTVHVVLGATILALAVVRLVWRVTTPLPPWAATLSRSERRLAHLTERTLYVLMFVIPTSGLLVVTTGGDYLAAHIASHVAFYIVIAIHVGLVLKHQFVDRDHLLRRML